MRGWLAAPLVRRDGTNLGLVQLSDKAGLDRDGRRREFDETDQVALVQLAQVARLALEKAVEFEREHEVAVELQRSLLQARGARPRRRVGHGLMSASLMGQVPSALRALACSRPIRSPS